MAGRRPTNPLALAVLTLLAENPMHPYEMSANLKERRKEDSIKLNYGSLYSVVDSLEKRGYITVLDTVQDGNRPPRTIYAITDTGSELMTEWLSALISTPVKEFPQFEAALSLMPALSPDTVLTLLRQRLDRVVTHKRDVTSMLASAKEKGLPRLFIIEHQYELALLEADVDFVTNLVAELSNGTFEGLEGWRRFDELRASGRDKDDIDRTLRAEFPEQFGWDETHQN